MAMQIPKDPLILVDGSGYLFRAYHALPPLTTTKGLPTGAIYGVTNMLRNIIKTYAPSHIAVIFDTKEKNFRHKIFPQYKANRTEMPDELAQQIEPLHKVIRAMGIPLIAIPGLEADDVIGTLAVTSAKNNKFVLISTGDKDMAQLVNDKVILINTMSNTIMDRQGVIDKFEVPPELIVDYLSLIGDSVDNIPGIEKVGPKTAVKWLKTYGNVANLVQHVNDIPGKIGENLKNGLDKLDLYKELTTIKIDLDLNLTTNDLQRFDPDYTALKDAFTELEFKTWLKEVSAYGTQGENVKVLDEHNKDLTEHNKITHEHEAASHNKHPPHTVNYDNYTTILTKSDFESLLQKLHKVAIFAVDTETDNLEAIHANLVGISFAINAGEAYYIPLAHDYIDSPPQLALNYVLENLKPLLEDQTKIKVGHNIKYDMEVFANYNVEILGTTHDTMLQSYVLNSVSGRHNMDNVAARELNITTITYEDVTGKGAKQIQFGQVDIDTATKYAAEDADVTLMLHNAMYPKIEAIKGILYTYNSIELPLISVIKIMEYRGVLIDKTVLLEQSKDLAHKLLGLEEKVEILAGHKFNVNSPKQLQEVLYEKLGLPILQKTPTGQPSTAEDVLQELSLSYELPKIILDYRSLSKLKSTYTDKLPQKISGKTGRIHTSYHQAVTTTGRLSSSDPNLQNIPAKTTEGRKIRAAFIAPKGYKILSADYSQIELRIMAHLSNDTSLINAFKRGEDVHKATASEVWGVPLDAVTDIMRRNAKAINFGLIYGMSYFGLGKQLGIERSEAQEYIDSYFSKFPKVKDYMEQTKVFAQKHGFVETMFGRRLYLPEINAKNHMRKKAAERAAINAPLQGAQADIIKLAMIKLNTWIIENELDINMIMQVHDELVFEVKESLISKAEIEIPKIMRTIVDLSVDLIVGVGIGANWEDAH